MILNKYKGDYKMEEDKEKEKVDDYMLETIFDGLLNAIKTKDKNNSPAEDRRDD